MKYFEIIGSLTGKVIGVCTEDGVIDAAHEDSVTFGRIPEKRFARYDSAPWNNPTSRDRFEVKVVHKIVKIKT